MAEQLGTTLGTASAILNRLGNHMENRRTANTRSEIQKRELQGQRMVAKDNEKTDTGETLDLSQEGIIDTRTCRSDTYAPERDTPPKQGEKDTWYTDTGVAIDKQRGSPLGMTQRVPAAVAGNRAATRPASADTWRRTSAEKAHTDGTFHGPQDSMPDTRPPAGTPARGTLPKQKPDTTSKVPKRPTITHYVPRPMREKLNQKPAADPTELSPEPPVQETTPAEMDINGRFDKYAKTGVTVCLQSIMLKEKTTVILINKVETD